MKRLLSIIGIVLVANAGALVLVARNSRGTPDASLLLTEREMRLTTMDADTTGMTLTLQWDRRTPMPWFDRAKLTSLGFDCSMPAEAPGALRHYSGPWMLPRAAYVVFEYDPSRVVANDAVAADEGPPGESPVDNRAAKREVPEYVSRLRPVDVGNDPTVLRSSYTDRRRYLITNGTVRPNLVRANANQPARLQGQVQWVDPIQVYVPQEMQAAIVAALGKDGNRQPVSAPLTHAPRYEVTIEYGRSLLPKIVGVKPIMP